MRHTSSEQKGISLVMSLIMLLVLTLMTISYVNSSNSAIRVVGNMQYQEEVVTAAQRAIEEKVAAYANFQTPASKTFQYDIDNDGTADYQVIASAPQCTTHMQVSGYSTDSSAPLNTYWDMTINVIDLHQGSASGGVIKQGYKVVMDPWDVPSGC